MQLEDEDWHCTFELWAVCLSFFFACLAMCVQIILRTWLGLFSVAVKWFWSVSNFVCSIWFWSEVAMSKYLALLFVTSKFKLHDVCDLSSSFSRLHKLLVDCSQIY